MNNLVNDINQISNFNLLHELNKKLDKLKNYKNNDVEKLKNSGNINKEEFVENDFIKSIHRENYSNTKNNSIHLFSVCQYCNIAFNSSENLPLLFECGHFFCKACVLNFSKENKNNPICPEDGYTQNSIENLKVMRNLIHENNHVNKLISNNGSFNCKIHTKEKLKYYCYNTEELLCVYCAFNLFRINSNYKIVEMSENCGTILKSVNDILEHNEIFIRSLRQSLSEMKKNKVDEESRINSYFKDLHSMLEDKRSYLINQVSMTFSQNSVKIEKNFEYFIKKMQDADIVKNNINLFLSNQLSDFNKIHESYLKFIKENNNHDQIEILQLKFIVRSSEFQDLLSNIAEISPQSKYISPSKQLINITEDLIVKSTQQEGIKDFFERTGSLNKVKSTSQIESKLIKNNQIDNLTNNNKIITPKLKRSNSKIINRQIPQEILDTVQLLEENDNQYEKIKQQFNLKNH